MPSHPAKPPWAELAAPNILARASAVLAREAARIPATPFASPGPNGIVPGPVASARSCPVTGARPQPQTPDPDGLRRQAQDLLGLISSMVTPGEQGRSSPYPSGAALLPVELGNEIRHAGVSADPFVRAGVPIPAPQLDAIRKLAHEFIESLLVTFNQATGEKAAPYEDQVPLIRCVAPVQAGATARATLGIANDESTPGEVSLYCTNFVADSGFEIPSLRVTVSPRRVTIPPGGEASFEIAVAVPQQAPAGIYSGLVQAAGSKYVKAILSVEVL